MENQMDGEGITYAEMRMFTIFYSGNLKRRSKFVVLGVDGSTIYVKMGLKEIGYETVNCARMSQVSDQGADLMNINEC
jgi:hypothetical protein